MSTIEDVAKLAKVSIATVSRVINNSSANVREETRNRILEAIKELDYHPNALAKGLQLNKTMNIGVIIPDISNPYYAEIVRGIQDEADELGYGVIMQNTDWNLERIVKQIYLLREKLADGIIFSGGLIHNFSALSALRDMSNRVVVIGRHEVNFPAIRVDNIGGATLAVKHLLELGHRRIAFMCYNDSSTSVMDRFTGYMNAFAQYGLQPDKDLIKEGIFSTKTGYCSASELFSSDNRPTAVFASNDQIALGVMHAAREMGISVPEDLSIVGFDDIPISEYFTPPLTTVKVPIYDVGKAAMKLVYQVMNHKEYERNIWFNTQLIIRGTTALCRQKE